ncbi:HD domain-containing protein [Bacillus sp. FJAT-22090]|uniref:HD domain-containing protein n=1 Tax=Bacillus sp. FJAT-22090 TaxID=1581038 RepID=UPI00119CA955|nr:HD domain-containing protein [Bacillus sp. FJAT-22090]
MSYATQKLAEEKVFKDPVHRYIHVRDQVIWDVIGAKEFQRLRRIKQLGTTYLVFHGAEHSRFSHSLGVYEIVRRIVDDSFEGRSEWDASERLVVLCAALLHDLGHGPFSHAFENVFNLDHEEYTRKILLGDTEVHEILKKVSKDFPQKVADVIAKTYSNKQVVSLISSQIDADRMDYLQRDAYFTGVSYGHFDMERILRVMRPREDQIVIKSSGMHAVEDYIMSRYQMYWQVYFHPVSRSAEVILTKILHRAKALSKSGYDFEQQPTHFQGFFDGTFTLNDYLALDEGVLLTYFQLWITEKDPILSDLSYRFVNRKLFQYIEFDLAKDYTKMKELELLFKKAGIDPEYYLVFDSSSDLPYDFYRPGEEGERIPIHLLMPSGEIRELSRESEVVEAISGKRRTDHKLYFPEDFLTEDGKKKALKKQILELLK